MKNKILKELLIIVLLVLVVIFSVGILFYDCISMENDNIVFMQDEKNDEIENILQEIEVFNEISNSQNTNNTLLKSYSYTSDKEETYIENSNELYEKGKKDPFSGNIEDEEENKNETEIFFDKPNSK